MDIEIIQYDCVFYLFLVPFLDKKLSNFYNKKWLYIVLSYNIKRVNLKGKKMKKLVLGFGLLLGVHLHADVVADGYAEYKKNNYAEAIALWGQACDSGNMDGCYNLAYMYENGKGSMHNELKASELYTIACDAGDARACSNLGVIYENGKGSVKQDFFKSSQLYAKSCNAGNINGCYNLGVSYHRGRGAAKDYQMASVLYDYTCKKGQIEGCYYLAEMYRNGKGIEKNKSEAKRLYGKVCDMGSSSGCSKFRRLSDEGV